MLFSFWQGIYCLERCNIASKRVATELELHMLHGAQSTPLAELECAGPSSITHHLLLKKDDKQDICLFFLKLTKKLINTVKKLKKILKIK